jgi:diguanylate cyclase (GGDEF)-like protein
VPFAVLQIELNHFRAYNERHGFGRGDDVIKSLAQCLTEAAKAAAADSFIGHLGGVNFAILAPDGSVEKLGLDILERFEEQIAPPEVTLTIVGLSAAQTGPASYHTLIGRTSRWKRMARSVHRSVFILDGRVLRGPELPRPEAVM